MSLSDNGLLSTPLAPCCEIKVHQKLLSVWLELSRKTRPWLWCLAVAILLVCSFQIIYAKNSPRVHIAFSLHYSENFFVPLFVRRAETGFVIASTNETLSINRSFLKWVISTPLDHCVSCFMMACWCKLMCLHLCGGATLSLAPCVSQTQLADIPLEWQLPIMMSWVQQPSPV